MTRVVLSVQAERDLEEIGDYIAGDSPQRALAFISALRAHCDRIARAPFAYPARPELADGVRTCTHGPYLIVFRPGDETVLIVRILHGARNLPALFRDDP
ncbi:MAG: type II toxin-antitoxin system RelE/ParE family toxin [Rhodocyclaceae bacterium]